MTIVRCLCGHGASRHYHLDGTKSCRICTTCRSLRPRCTALAYSKGRGGTRWPGPCTAPAKAGSEFCGRHGK